MPKVYQEPDYTLVVSTKRKVSPPAVKAVKQRAGQQKEILRQRKLGVALGQVKGKK